MFVYVADGKRAGEAGVEPVASASKVPRACQLHHSPPALDHPRRRWPVPWPPMPAPTAVILAAGQGTRMRSATPKVLHPICGRPMGAWPVQAALDAGAAKVVVVGGPDRALEALLPDNVVFAVQEEPLGTGDAVR